MKKKGRIKVRKSWTMSPVTKVKESDKKYDRKVKKFFKDIEEALQKTPFDLTDTSLYG